MMRIHKKAMFAKPCPFCGSRNVITESKKSFYKSGNRCCSYIRCDECGAETYGNPVRNEKGQFIMTYNSAQHEALAVWNRRSA